MTKEQAIEILKCFKDNKIQRDKLEIDNRCGGWKIGKLYKSLELDIAIETVLSMLKEKDEQIEEYRKIGLRTHKQQVQTKKSLKGIINNQNKIIDLMAETINFIGIDIKTIQRQIKEQYCDYIKSDVDCCWKTDKNCTDCIKEYFENKAKENPH